LLCWRIQLASTRSCWTSCWFLKSLIYRIVVARNKVPRCIGDWSMVADSIFVTRYLDSLVHSINGNFQKEKKY
ncbi:hypothetical protein ACJX0J_042360, partial [Zea mays]